MTNISNTLKLVWFSICLWLCSYAPVTKALDLIRFSYSVINVKTHIITSIHDVTSMHVATCTSVIDKANNSDIIDGSRGRIELWF